jgi:N-acetylmuramoyl-L-alanine amidase
METDALVILARTVYGEARSESWIGKVAVAWVVRNRAAKGGWWGADVLSCCMKPWQFSCWNANDPNRKKLEQATTRKSAIFRECLAAAAAVLADLEPDPTGGATHYFADYIQTPKWAKGKTPTITIGHHLFFTHID